MRVARRCATIIWPLLIYWLVLFVACFVVVEFGQDQLYDEVTPHAGLKVAGGSLLIAILLTVLAEVRLSGIVSSRCSPTNIIWTVLQGAGLVRRVHPDLPVPPLACAWGWGWRRWCW